MKQGDVITVIEFTIDLKQTLKQKNSLVWKNDSLVLRNDRLQIKNEEIYIRNLYHGNLRYPPLCHPPPPGNKALLRETNG